MEAPLEERVSASGLGSRAVLIVEDDTSLRPFWEYVVHQVEPRLELQWVSSVSGAEQLVRESLKKRHALGLIIADLYLEGQRTGVDLWREFKESLIPFVMTSGMSKERFLNRFSKREDAPLYLEKPLELDECVETIRIVLDGQNS
jgi:DNA-binding NtrC family response regulator